VIAAYYGYISMIDHYVGQILQTLDQRGLSDNTLIIFTADHGDYLGQFKCWYKGSLYGGATRVPMIVCDPAHHGAARFERTPVSTADVFTTCLAAAGCTPPARRDSDDLRAVVHHGADAGRPPVFHKSGALAFVVDGAHKLCREARDDGAVYELYDLGAEGERLNVIDRPAYQDALERMKPKLERFVASQEEARDARASGLAS
jgi:arylsulfatase A-like enzyme